MSIEVFSIVVLFVLFMLASFTPIHLGLMGFLAAFVVGSLIGGLSLDDVIGGFPADLFIILFGVTFLFAIVQNNGTIDLMTGWAERAVGGRVALIPPVMFLLTAVLAAAGAFTPAAVAIVAPIALGFAAQNGFSPFVMGAVIVQGANAGAFSPINPFGVVANGILESRDLPTFPVALFLNAFLFNAAVAALLLAVYYGWRAVRGNRVGAAGGSAAPDPTTPEGEPAAGPDEGSAEDGAGRLEVTPYRALTLFGLVLLVVLTLGFGVDVGFGAIAIALLLVVVQPRQQASALSGTAWSAILLVTGIVTYVSVLESLGTIAYVQDLIAGVGSSSIAALATSYVVGIVSAFASTTGTLGAIPPLVAPLLQDPAISAVGLISAIAVSSAIVDVSPFSTTGALLLANARGVGERVLFRQILAWAVLLVVLGPLVAWLVFVATGIF